MDESILMTIKKMLGLEADYTPFDTDVIVLINSVLMTLTQADVGPKKGFRITGMSESWGDFLTNEVMLEAAKQFVYMKVKMIFDPPSSSIVMDALKTQSDEILWRLIAQAESVETFDFIVDDDSRGFTPHHQSSITNDEIDDITD